MESGKGTLGELKRREGESLQQGGSTQFPRRGEGNTSQ